MQQTKVENIATMSVDATLRTIQKRRTANFREDETRLLIQLWGSPSIQNKLFLTHRKAPVMRLLAANMQQRGFYRTPDEIKTRIRNLKCLYHRIKRTMASGAGIGTVDPDWPHYKAMDEILSKEYPRKLVDRILEEQIDPKFEVKIKQELDDIDIDDNDSWATNESLNSEYNDEASQGSPAPITPIVTINQPPKMPHIQHGSIQVKKTSSLQAQPMQTLRMQGPGSVLKTPIPIQPALTPANLMSTIQLPGSQLTQNGQMHGQKGGIPFPLLILNNLNAADKNNAHRMPTGVGHSHTPSNSTNDLLKELIQLQKQGLEMTKQQIEIEQKRLEFDRVISTQMVTLLPMLSGVLERLAYPSNPDIIGMPFDGMNGVKRKRSPSEDMGVVKDSKKLHNLLEKGIRKYMLLEEDAPCADARKSAEKMDNNNLNISDHNASMDDVEVEIAVDDDEADKESDRDMDIASIDGHILEPRVIIENAEDGDDQNDEDDDDGEDDDEEEKLVIETSSPRSRRSN